MTDRETGRAIAMRCNIIVTDEGLDLLGRTARELLTAGDVWDAGEIKAQLDRIEKEQGYQSERSAACVAMLHGLAEREIRIEKKLDWLYTNRTLTFSNQKWPA